MPSQKFLRTYAHLLLIVAVLIIVSVGGFGWHVYKSHQPIVASANHEACAILTPAIAQALGGKNLVKQTIKTIDTADTRTTFCVYRSEQKSVSLIVRTAKSSQGTQLNRAAFSKPAVANQKIRTYGDDAYWTPTLAQLNILKHDNWYILSNGPTIPSKRTLTDSEKLANRIINQL